MHLLHPTRRLPFGLAVLVIALCAACSDPAAKKQAYFESGNRYIAEKKYDEAIIQYRNAVDIDATLMLDDWLDGYGRTHTDDLYQTVTIPAGACSATLSFWLKITR